MNTHRNLPGFSHFVAPRHRHLDHSSEIWNFCWTKLKAFCYSEKDEAMKKTLMALAAAALTISAVSSRRLRSAARVAAGVAAGLFGGAIVGGAIASQNGHTVRLLCPGYYGGGLAYVVDPGYGEPASGSGSGSGMVMAGGSATSGFAINAVHLHKLRASSERRRFSGMNAASARKPFFSTTVLRTFTFD